jgi:hypothetical protein
MGGIKTTFSCLTLFYRLFTAVLLRSQLVFCSAPLKSLEDGDKPESADNMIQP